MRDHPHSHAHWTNTLGRWLAYSVAKAAVPNILIPSLERGEKFLRTLQSKGLDTPLYDQVESASIVLPSEKGIVFDVGANQGAWTAALLRAYGNQIEQVHCFEPAPINIKKLESLNHSRITIHPFAVGCEEGRRDFFSDFPGSGIASFFNRNSPNSPKAVHVDRVKVRTLDNVIGELGVPRVDLVKMDIEGAEFEALKGAHNSISNGMIRAFTFEFGGVNISGRLFFSDYYNYIVEELGFQIFRMAAGGGLYQIRRYHEALECFVTTNYLATR
jgi:FkbM family methyltransferase